MSADSFLPHLTTPIPRARNIPRLITFMPGAKAPAPFRVLSFYPGSPLPEPNLFNAAGLRVPHIYDEFFRAGARVLGSVQFRRTSNEHLIFYLFSNKSDRKLLSKFLNL